jgi:hypothetical protein
MHQRVCEILGRDLAEPGLSATEVETVVSARVIQQART